MDNSNRMVERRVVWRLFLAMVVTTVGWLAIDSSQAIRAQDPRPQDPEAALFPPDTAPQPAEQNPYLPPPTNPQLRNSDDFLPPTSTRPLTPVPRTVDPRVPPRTERDTDPRFAPDPRRHSPPPFMDASYPDVRNSSARPNGPLKRVQRVLQVIETHYESMSPEELQRQQQMTQTLKQLKDGDEQQQAIAKKKLQSLLEEAFDDDMAAREKKLEQLEAQVAKLRQAFDKRVEARDEIVQHRFRGLELASQGLSYPTQQAADQFESASRQPQIDVQDAAPRGPVPAPNSTGRAYSAPTTVPDVTLPPPSITGGRGR